MMTTLAILLVLTAAFYFIVRHENKPKMQPLRIRHDDQRQQRLNRRK